MELQSQAFESERVAAEFQKGEKSRLERLKEKLKANPVPLIIGTSIVGIALLSCVYCACAKKACFAQKEEMEGGQTDKQIFKKEVKKSKSSRKRDTKESLVPTFKVEEEA